MLPVGELEGALERFYAPGTSNEEKRSIENGLEQLKQNENAIQYACSVLNETSNQYALWFACAVLEHVVQTRWQHTGDKERIREFLFKLLVDRGAALPKLVSNKVSKVLVEIAKHDWPEQYPEFFLHVKTACASETHASRLIGLQMLLTTTEEFSTETSKVVVSSRRKNELRKLLRNELADIVSIVERNLEHGIADPSRRGTEQATLTLTFDILLHQIHWAPLNQCFSEKVVAMLLQYMTLTASPHAVQALSCVNELLERNYIPKDFDEFVVKVALSALETLQVLATNQELLEDCADGFINQYTRFLCVFLRKHLRKVEKTSQFPNERFLELLSAYTLAQPAAEDFLHCLEAWAVYVQLVQDDPSQPTRGLYVKALSAFMMKLVDRVLWQKSQDVLECIDDDATDHVEGSAERAAESSALGKLTAMETMTELEAYFTRVVRFIGEIAVLPSEAGAGAGVNVLLLEVGRNLEITLPRLSTVLSGSSSASNESTLNAVSDVSWLFSIVAAVAPCLASPERLADSFSIMLQFLKWPVEVLGAATHVRLFTRGARYVRLHVSALRLVASFAPWLRAVGLLANKVYAVDGEAAALPQALAQVSEAASFAGSLDNHVSQLTELALASTSSQISPPPEEVSVAAIGLVAAIGTQMRPLNFFSYPAIAQVAQNLAAFSAGLPIEARSVLYLALSDSVLAAARSSPDPASALQQAAPMYDQIVGSEARRLVGLVEQIHPETADGAAIANRAQACRAHLCILSELALSQNAAPTVMRAFVARHVLVALPATVQLIGLLLPPSQSPASGQGQDSAGGRRGVASMSSGTARDALDLIVNTLRAFGKQAGTAACQDTIAKLVSLFCAKATAQSLAETGSGGVLLLLKLMRLFVVLMDEPSNFFKGLLPSVLSMCFDEIPQVVRVLASSQTKQSAPGQLPEEAFDLLEVQYDLLHKVLRQHWRTYFFKTTTAHSVGAPKETVFASEESRRFFVRAMELLLESFQQEGIPPSVFRRNLSIFDDLNSTHRLFDQHDFRHTMRPAFIRSLLQLLVANSHQLLEEEILVTVYGLAVVDMPGFYDSILPDFVRWYVQSARNVELPSQTLSTILGSVPREVDMPSFTLNFHDFASDLRFFVATM